MLNFMMPYKLLRSRLKLMYHVYEAHNDHIRRIVDHCDDSFVDFYPEDFLLMII